MRSRAWAGRAMRKPRLAGECRAVDGRELILLDNSYYSHCWRRCVEVRVNDADRSPEALGLPL